MTGLKSYLLVATILLVAVILLANKLVVWGAAFIAAGLIILGIQQLILLNVKVSKFEDNISGLEDKNQGLSGKRESRRCCSRPFRAIDNRFHELYS